MFRSRGITARAFSGIPAAGVISFLSRGCWTAGVRRQVSHFLAGLTATLVLLGASVAWGESPFQYQEVMVPMRDGVHLQTVILTPIRKKRAAPDSSPAHSLRSAGKSSRRRFLLTSRNCRRTDISSFSRICAGVSSRRACSRCLPQVDLNEPQGRQRDNRRIRHHRLAGQECPV